MKIINKFLLALTCLFVFASCDVMSPSVSIFDGSGTSYSSSDNIKKADYYGTVDYYADSKGIHISIPLEEHKINKITLYEIQGITDIHMATVKTVSPLYNYALDGSPCGEIMYEVKGEAKTEKRSYYRTNYLEGTITLDLSFVEPGKNYNFLLALDEPELETGGGGTYYSSNTSNYEKTPKVRYFKRFSLRAANEVFYSDFIEAEYNSETDRYTVKPVDVKTLGLPFAIKDYSDVSMTASALYKDSLDSKRTPIPVPLAINPVTTTESSLSIIAENIADADYGADYVLASISGSLQFTDHLDYQINDSSTTDEKIAYYTQLYSQKTYSYNCPYIRSSGVTKTVNFSDRRMNLTVTPEADDNLVSFVMLTDASAISIYRQSAEEKLPFLAGAMSGSFKRGETYTFVDYYAEPGVVYTYYVTWDGGRKSKLVSVTTTSSMKYKPNAPVMTYKYDSEEAKGVFTIVTNPFTGKLPEDYHGKIVFEYCQKYTDYNMSQSRDIFNMTITDSDTSYIIFKNDIYYELINYDDVRLTVKEPSSESYFVTITAQKEGINYQHYYLLKEKGSMPVIDFNDDSSNNESSEKENQNEKEFEISDIKLNAGEEFYTLKPSVKDDYAELKSITQKEDGSVSIEIYLPAWTNYAHIRRDVIMKYTEELFNTHAYSSMYFENGQNFLGFTDADFYIDVQNKTGDITIIDFNITEGMEYDYILEADSVKPYATDDVYNRNRWIWSIGLYPNLIAQKSSDYYLTTLPSIKGFSTNDIEGNLMWNKLPEGYSMIDGKEITQKVVSRVDSVYINDKWVDISDKNIFKKSYLFGSFDWSGNTYYCYPSLNYKCTEITGQDKYYEDEYGNKTEKVFEENAIELKYEIGKKLQLKDTYCSLNNWSREDSNSNNLHGIYTLQNVKNMPFICDYGIWIYKTINTDHITDKTFTISE